ncbi:unnamed protein product [Pleuronectes platessa]|uniref:Uncharacterized protein n=1 Tax=Pleuronectes platessa TaxID=8262 RepID=A0A9N7U4D8_PLEPL|nr:unnamed protein product [Pleuronectes platessa]
MGRSLDGEPKLPSSPAQPRSGRRRDGETVEPGRLSPEPFERPIGGLLFVSQVRPQTITELFWFPKPVPAHTKPRPEPGDSEGTHRSLDTQLVWASGQMFQVLDEVLRRPGLTETWNNAATREDSQQC